MRWFEDIVRLILVISVIMTCSFYNFDFKVSLIVLSLVYFFQSIILYPVLKGTFLKYLIYIIDASYILYVINITDQVYLSMFWFMLIANIRLKLEIVVVFILSILISGFSFYQSGFYDFNLVFLSVAFMVVILNFLFQQQKKDQEVKSFIELSKDLYRENLICNDRKDFFERFYNIKKAIKNFLNGGINFEQLVDILYDSLNCDAVVLIDTHTGEYQLRGKLKVSDETVYHILQDNIEEIKKELNIRFVVLKDIGQHRIVLIYRDYMLIDRELIEAIE